MKNADQWKPTKFERTDKGVWRSNRKKVPARSRLIADRLASVYAAAIATHVKGRLADLGCGAVPLYGIYRDHVSDVFCVDWPGSTHGAAYVDLFADLNEQLTLEEGSFDTVIASDVIEHLHTPQALFDSAARALRPGGKLIIGVPFFYWLHEMPHDYHRYTRFALERMTMKAGLSTIELSSYGGVTDVLSDLATKAVASRPWIANLVYWLTTLMRALPPVKKLGLATRESMPMGYLLVAEKVSAPPSSVGG
ncbi:class I SAM-dependent methyltransferase [Mesorhizobium sp.]|uniref:class I SAM-dependent methyltransferase n=1 Tax=Mesorhizobium sp. TaxID=1871066 RepID=UPI000FE938F2|nr:class I SAM-dependent methyltransferase [Mesorhizobium sp.]RWO61396.1 MAG: class I SAM-dependent methyltransferase [Mesorhizobium sp.]